MMSTRDLRDYFAANAVSGILANNHTDVGAHVDMSWIAEKGFEIADQMLKAKKKAEKSKTDKVVVKGHNDLDLT